MKKAFTDLIMEAALKLSYATVDIKNEAQRQFKKEYWYEELCLLLKKKGYEIVEVQVRR